jgi:hypothetical protein
MSFKEYVNEGWFPTKDLQRVNDIYPKDIVELVKPIKGADLTVGETYNVIDVDEDGNLKINNDLGIEWSETYFDHKFFKKFN